MKLSTKAKKALVTLRKELGFSPTDIKTMLGDAVTLSMIKDFENNNDSENDFLIVVYFNIFHFITSERLELEDAYHKPEDDVPFSNNRINPFKRNPFESRTD